VTIVADAGPLMALAKVDALGTLFRLFPKILTPPAVYEELITEGLRLGAPDAVLLQACYRSGELEVVSPRQAALRGPMSLGPGEEQSILLAIEVQATWLLIDDLDARRAALASLSAAGAKAQVKGTLGVILSAWEEGHVEKQEAIGSVEALRQRQDIWIGADLCQRVLDRLERGRP